MNSNAVRKTSVAALTAVGIFVAIHIQPSKKRAVYWGVTDQLDLMNSSRDEGAIEVGEELR